MQKQKLHYIAWPVGGSQSVAKRLKNGWLSIREKEFHTGRKQVTMFLLVSQNHPIGFISSDLSSILSKNGHEVVGAGLKCSQPPSGRGLGAVRSLQSPLTSSWHHPHTSKYGVFCPLSPPAGTGAVTPGGRSSVPPTASGPASTGSSWWGS